MVNSGKHRNYSLLSNLFSTGRKGLSYLKNIQIVIAIENNIKAKIRIL